MLKIFINPGHDIDLDPGACANGLREVDIALAIGKQVKQIMEGIGYPCQLIQSDNLNGETPSKPNVCGTANASGVDIFVSIHCNSAANASAKGTERLFTAQVARRNCWLNVFNLRLYIHSVRLTVA